MKVDAIFVLLAIGSVVAVVCNAQESSPSPTVERFKEFVIAPGSSPSPSLEQPKISLLVPEPSPRLEPKGGPVAKDNDYAVHLAALQHDPIKSAVFSVLGAECTTFNAAEAKIWAEQNKILADAGPGIIPAITYLVSDKFCNPGFIGAAADYATKYPLSEPLRTALRARREDKDFEINPWWYLGVFEYFATFGDRSDLTWMETTYNRMYDTMRPDTSDSMQQFHRQGFQPYATESIQQLRKRLLQPLAIPKDALQRTEAGGQPPAAGQP